MDVISFSYNTQDLQEEKVGLCRVLFFLASVTQKNKSPTFVCKLRSAHILKG